MSKDDKNRSWCLTDTPTLRAAELPKPRRLSSDFSNILTRRAEYEAQQARLRQASSSDSLSAVTARCPRTSSSVNSISDPPPESGRIARWAVSIDAVLNDSLGRIAFSYHLRREHSEENLKFWIDCERFRRTFSSIERHTLASIMTKKYIGDGAELPVNLPCRLETMIRNCCVWDSCAFLKQQEHIYDLIKKDSYPRFIKSDQYRKLVSLELTYKSVTEIDILEAFEKRREQVKQKKSAFQILRKAVTMPKVQRKERRKSVDAGHLLQWGEESDGHEKCFVHFSDGRNMRIDLVDDLTVQEVLGDLVNRINLDMNHVDWMLIGETRENSIVMDQNSLILKNCHIRAELRCTFRVDLLHIKRRIAIRAKPQKPIRDVLTPILEKYSDGVDLSRFRLLTESADGTTEPVEMGDQAIKIDNKRLLLEIIPEKEDSFFGDNSIQDNTSKSIDKTFLSRRSAFRTAKKKKKRRESFGLRRARTKSKIIVQDASPFNRPSDAHLAFAGVRGDTSNISRKSMEISRPPLDRIDTQRGLLNKEELRLPKFLQDQKDLDDEIRQRTPSDSFGGDLQGVFPSAAAGYALFGSATKGFPQNSFNSLGDSGHISGLNGLFDDVIKNENVEFESHDSMENLYVPVNTCESLTDWEDSSSSRYHEEDTHDSLDGRILRNSLFRAGLHPALPKSHSSPASLRQVSL